MNCVSPTSTQASQPASEDDGPAAVDQSQRVSMGDLSGSKISVAESDLEITVGDTAEKTHSEGSQTRTRSQSRKSKDDTPTLPSNVAHCRVE